MRVAVAAPTGKAARRITEATGIPALTIHRLLEFTSPGEPDPVTGKPMGVSVPRRHARNKLDVDAILCDEYSMVDDALHRQLLDALHRQALLRAFGDINQLPPVEESPYIHPGQDQRTPFERLVSSPNSVKLEKIHRQGEGSGVALAGQRIIMGRVPEQRADFVIRSMGINHIPAYIMALAMKLDLSSMQNQLIIPNKKGDVGVRALNDQLQQFYRGDAVDSIRISRAQQKEPSIMLKRGDKIVYTKNNYDLNLFNGDMGIVKDFNHADGTVIIDFYGNDIALQAMQVVVNPKSGKMFTFDPRKFIDLAYAMTTHKAQGSEYETVVYALCKSASILRTRSNLYTGITRAKKNCMVVTDGDSIGIALRRVDRRF